MQRNEETEGEKPTSDGRSRYGRKEKRFNILSILTVRKRGSGGKLRY